MFRCWTYFAYVVRLIGFDLHFTELSADINSRDLQLSVDTLNKEMERMIDVAPEAIPMGIQTISSGR